MNILIISPYLPHPLCGHGAGVFIYELLQRLSRRHEVTLVSFCDDREQELAKDLNSLPITFHSIYRQKNSGKNLLSLLALVIIRLYQLLDSIVRWQPYYVSKYRDPRMRALIADLTTNNNFDIVQIEFTQMAQYVSYVKKGKTLLHELDVSFKPAYRKYKKAKNVFLKALLFIEWCRWANYEPAYARIFDAALTVTDQDRLLLQWLSKSKKVYYFPHAVDAPAQIPDYSSRKPRTLVFLGTYKHHPNVDAAEWMCKEIFPKVLEKYPDATAYIVGPHPSPAMLQFASANPNIKVTGFVDDVNLYLQECAVFLCPLRFGGGVKNKVLYAMAQGIPVVSTSIGIEGIDGANASNVIIGDSVEKIVENISKLFENTDEAARLGVKGWKNVRDRYSWDSIISIVEEIYNH